MKRTGDKLTNTLLFVNKNITNNDGTNSKKYEEKKEMKSLSTITATATSNPFAYLMRNDKKNEVGVDLMVRIIYLVYFSNLNSGVLLFSIVESIPTINLSHSIS